MTEPAESPAPGKFDRHKTINRVLDQLDEITEPRNISEQYDAEGRVLAKRHVHTLPSLLEALRAAVVPGGDVGQQTGARAFESRPAARLDPIVVIADADATARKWCATFNVQRSSTLGHLVALKGSLGGCSDHTLRLVALDVQRVYTAARIATGYDDPPTTVDEPCPVCTRRQTLTWNRREDEVRAWCSRCGTNWPADKIGILVAMLDYNRTKEMMTDEDN